MRDGRRSCVVNTNNDNNKETSEEEECLEEAWLRFWRFISVFFLVCLLHGRRTKDGGEVGSV